MLMTWSDYAVGLRGWTSCDLKYREVKSQRMETTRELSVPVLNTKTTRASAAYEGDYGGPKSVNVRERKAKSPQIVSDTLYSNF